MNTFLVLFFPYNFYLLQIDANFQLYALRTLMQGEKDLPKAPLGNNVRPSMPLHYRTILTNIDFKKTPVSTNIPVNDVLVSLVTGLFLPV